MVFVPDGGAEARIIYYQQKNWYMQNWLRTLIAGWGAYKLGGGCLGFVVVFVIIYWLLGHC